MGRHTQKKKAANEKRVAQKKEQLKSGRASRNGMTRTQFERQKKEGRRKAKP